MKNKILFTALTLMCLIGSVSLVYADQETQLNIQTKILLSPPSIHGNYVSWADSGASASYLYDLTKGQEKGISTDRTSCTPSIYDNNAVFWQEGYLELYNINSGKLTELAPCSHYRPSIYGNIVVYIYSDVYTYDISTNTMSQITNSGTAENPVIYGNNIVYQEESNIYVYSISSKQRTRIDTGSHPNIYGNVVVWANNGNIYMRDISTHKTTQITANGISNNPAIYGDKIVWDTNTYSGNVYMYSISTEKTIQITNSNCAFYPAIYGNKIVYIDTRNRVSNNGDEEDLFVYDFSDQQAKPTAAFTTDVTSGIAPLKVTLTDKSTGAPTSWAWDFGDGGKSTERNPTHTYSSAGKYTINLTVSNANGWSSKTLVITVLEEQSGVKILPVANFNANPTSGYAPLTVQFTDSSQNAATWSWNFGDGTNSFDRNPTHTYSSAGTYTVTLEVLNAAGSDTAIKQVTVTEATPTMKADFTWNIPSENEPLTVDFTDISTGALTAWNWNFGDGANSSDRNPKHIYSSAGTYTVTLEVHSAADSKTVTHDITLTEATQKPVAGFICDFTYGSAPLHVTFTDTSTGAPTAWSWTFGDGAHSYDRNPTHTYSAEGTYNVNLVVSNAKGTASTATTITVQSSSGSESSGGSSSGGSGESDGGGAGGSPEPQSNVEVKELSQTFITSGSSAKFDFPQKATPVTYISFDSKRTVGKTTTIVEMLKRKSALVPVLPSEYVYKSLNIWVGNGGFGDSNNIENAVIYFMVEKSWVQDKNIDKSTITLNRFSDNTWSQLPSSPLSEDDNYLYFTAQTPGFSSFSITGKIAASEAVNEMQHDPNAQGLEQNPSNAATNSGKVSTKAPCFEVFYGILTLLAVFLLQKNN